MQYFENDTPEEGDDVNTPPSSDHIDLGFPTKLLRCMVKNITSMVPSRRERRVRASSLLAPSMIGDKAFTWINLASLAPCTN